MNPAPYLAHSERLILFSVLIQNLEMIFLRKHFSPIGIWSWSVLKKELRPGFIFSFYSFLSLQIFSALACALGVLYPQPISLWIATATAIITCLRWRGNFNGGSDYMSIIILCSLCLATWHPLQQAAIAYIAVQTIFSYFVAGWVKLKRAQWRSGVALTQLLTLSNYNVQPLIQQIVSRPRLSFLITWWVLLFECLFPLCVLHPDLCLIFIVIVFFFHLINAWALGLNRFWLTWMASYPVLYYFCLQISDKIWSHS